MSARPRSRSEARPSTPSEAPPHHEPRDFPELRYRTRGETGAFQLGEGLIEVAVGQVEGPGPAPALLEQLHRAIEPLAGELAVRQQLRQLTTAVVPRHRVNHGDGLLVLAEVARRGLPRDGGL